MNTKTGYIVSGLMGACFLAAIPMSMASDGANASDASSGESVDTLRVLTYNIRHGEGLDGKVNLKRLARVISEQKPDIVTLQEVDVNVGRSGNIDEAAELADLLQFHHAFGKAMDYKGGEYGNAILSRFPLKVVKVHPLTGGNEGRCALEVRVSVPRGTRKDAVTVITTHLNHLGDATIQQAGEVAALAVEAKKPTILAGDFNAVRGSAAMDKVEAVLNLPPSAGPTFPADHPKEEIDYIIPLGFPKGGKTTVIDEEAVSDHRPVLMVIPMPKAETQSAVQ